MKVNANQLRAGNVVEMDGKLYTVIKAQNITPGKGNAVTQVEFRRISDGVKTQERFRTTEAVERVYIDERDFQYLFQDGESYIFMDVESYEQIQVPGDLLGDQAVFLYENMPVTLSLYEGKAVAYSLPSNVTLEVTETDPIVKGQTAAASYKPAILSNGMRTMVPPHITPGTRVVIATEDGSYVERAKD